MQSGGPGSGRQCSASRDGGGGGRVGDQLGG